MPPPSSRIETANSLSLHDYRTRFLPFTLNSVTANAESPSFIEIKFESSLSIAPAHIQECFHLVASTSASAYAASSIGWSPSKKRKEMELPDLRYLLVLGPSQGTKIVEGFLSFMLTYEDGHEVIYCYEIHISHRLRGNGIGRHLVALMEAVGRNAEMEKSMLTVFVENEGALKFYDKLGYKKDEYSPGPRKLRNRVTKEPTYIILSKRLRSSEAG
ncbi:MAG: hypothetical protein LQ342_006156 [Letrouitia transgressa]|nr:MAG: hypothetical protein LQ342_006156 [Letrouitia transgressa]